MVLATLRKIIFQLKTSSINKRRVVLVVLLCLILIVLIIQIAISQFWPLVQFSISVFIDQPSYPLPSSNRTPPNISIAILSFYTGMRANIIRPLTEPNKMAYAKYQGYSYINGLDAAPFLLHDVNVHGGRIYGGEHYFLKFIALRHFLPLYDWILWSDADAIFLNFSRPLTDYIDHRYDMIFTATPPGAARWDGVINSGSMLLHNSKWTINFLDELISMSNIDCTKSKVLRGKFRDAKGEWTMPYINGEFQLCTSEGKLWLTDQGALQLFINYGDEEVKCHFKRIGTRDFNSIFHFYDDGDLVVHFAGRGGDQRFKLINLFLQYSNFTCGIVDRSNTDMLGTAFHYDYSLGLEKVFGNRPCK